MRYRRRLLTLLAVLAVVAVPALALRAGCVGNSCGRAASEPARVPFCSLPEGLREVLAAGFRDGRSPDVLAVPRAAVLRGGTDGESGVQPAWPAADVVADTAVPLVLAGTGIDAGAQVPEGTGLEAVAGSLAEVLGLERPFPRIQRGAPIPEIADGRVPRLILLVAWKGAGTSDLEAEPDAWPFLRSLMRRGTGTLRANTGSVPLDPAATLTTIGSGVLPAEHGITGVQLRNDQTGELARAWGRGAQVSVVTTLGDDLDELRDEAPVIGIVGTDPADRGVIGGNWYLEHDQDSRAFVAPGRVTGAAQRTLGSEGFGSDDETDLLAVVVRDSIEHMDQQLEDIVRDAERAAGDRLAVVVTGTGTTPQGNGDFVELQRVLSPVEDAVGGEASAIEAAVPGGIFLDRETLTEAGATSGVAVRALLSERDSDGRPLMADAFPAFAVSFARYCDEGSG